MGTGSEPLSCFREILRVREVPVPIFSQQSERSRENGTGSKAAESIIPLGKQVVRCVGACPTFTMSHPSWRARERGTGTVTPRFPVIPRPDGTEPVGSRPVGHDLR